MNQGPAAACSSLLLLYSFTQRLCWCLGWAFSQLILSDMLNSGIHPETPEQRRDAQHKPFPPATPELSFLGALSEANAPHPQELHSPKPGSAEPSAARGQTRLSLIQFPGLSIWGGGEQINKPLPNLPLNGK